MSKTAQKTKPKKRTKPGPAPQPSTNGTAKPPLTRETPLARFAPDGALDKLYNSSLVNVGDLVDLAAATQMGPPAARHLVVLRGVPGLDYQTATNIGDELIAAGLRDLLDAAGVSGLPESNGHAAPSPGPDDFDTPNRRPPDPFLQDLQQMQQDIEHAEEELTELRQLYREKKGEVGRKTHALRIAVKEGRLPLFEREAS